MTQVSIMRQISFLTASMSGTDVILRDPWWCSRPPGQPLRWRWAPSARTGTMSTRPVASKTATRHAPLCLGTCMTSASPVPVNGRSYRPSYAPSLLGGHSQCGQGAHLSTGRFPPRKRACGPEDRSTGCWWVSAGVCQLDCPSSSSPAASPKGVLRHIHFSPLSLSPEPRHLFTFRILNIQHLLSCHI